MARRMRDSEYKAEQLRRCFDEHVAPLNLLVDELRKENWAPYIAPIYGGVNARLLYVLRDPGPKTKEDGGSGFLCWENDDATAETLNKLFGDVGIEAQDVIPWNAYPWYINREPTAKELEAGVDPLKRVIDLLPNLKVVLLLGGSAHDSWDRFTRRYRATIASKGLTVIRTYHTSRQAFRHQDPAVRDQRREDLRQAFQDAAHQLARG